MCPFIVSSSSISILGRWWCLGTSSMHGWMIILYYFIQLPRAAVEKHAVLISRHVLCRSQWCLIRFICSSPFASRKEFIEIKQITYLDSSFLPRLFLGYLWGHCPISHPVVRHCWIVDFPNFPEKVGIWFLVPWGIFPRCIWQNVPWPSRFSRSLDVKAPLNQRQPR